ncbi:MAG: hypothetical protein Q9160_002256 [Pyrenula sp. 1 TL-2023]
MASSVPDGYMDLPKAWQSMGKIGNIVGVVVDYLTPTPTKGTDYAVTFTLIDSQWKASFEVRGEGLKCRYFKSDIKKLPSIESKGDVVVLRNMKITEWQGVPIAISTSTSVWQVLAEKDIPDVPGPNVSPRALPGTPSLPKSVMEYATALCNDQDRTSYRNANSVHTNAPFPVPQNQVNPIVQALPIESPQPHQKFRLIQDLHIPGPGEPLLFANLMGEVRKIYVNDFRVELSITDYTYNKDLFHYEHTSESKGRDGDKYGYTTSRAHESWPGPWGRMTMVVSTWDTNAQFARTSLDVGQYVFLRNVHIKHDARGSKLEGALRVNKQHPDQVGISIIQPTKAENDEDLKELLKRRRGYESKMRKGGVILLKDGKSKKHLHSQDNEKPQAESNNARRKREKRERKRKAKEGQSSVDGLQMAKIEANSHVVRKNVNISCTALEEVLDSSVLLAKSPEGNTYHLPFHNVSYLAKVRVLDFLPNRLEDFAAPHAGPLYDAILSSASEDSSSEMDIDSSGDIHWEWRFALLVEDASLPPRSGQERKPMILQVFGTDGDYLLNMDAEDLSKNSRALAKVREKLFVIWGDLEERKLEGRFSEPNSRDNQPSAKPFECLIKEYGAKRPGVQNGSPLEQWERCFRIYGTTIKM